MAEGWLEGYFRYFVGVLKFLSVYYYGIFSSTESGSPLKYVYLSFATGRTFAYIYRRINFTLLYIQQVHSMSSSFLCSHVLTIFSLAAPRSLLSRYDKSFLQLLLSDETFQSSSIGVLQINVYVTICTRNDSFLIPPPTCSKALSKR